MYEDPTIFTEESILCKNCFLHIYRHIIMGAKQSKSNYNEPSNPKNTLPENRATTEIMSLDEVYDSLDDYKEVINNVYSLNKLLNDYDEEIKEKANENDDNAINSILGATLHEEYDKTNEKYCEIIELARSKNEVGGCRVLFTCKHYESLDGMSLMNVMTANTSEQIDQLSFTNVAKLLENRIVDMSQKIPKYGKTYVHAGFGVWTGGIRLYFNLVRKHPIIENKWIMISSGININNYLSKPISNYKLFSYEYRLLMENITQVMNANMYLQIIEDSAEEATQYAEEAIAESEEKTALYNFSQKVCDNAPTDPTAYAKLQEAKMNAQNASRMASNSISTAKAAQYSLTEAETSIATKTTTWEYGPEEEYDNLRCIFSGIHPQWNGMCIRDCQIRGNKYNIQEVTMSVMADIEENYPMLFHNQTILTTYVTEHGHHIAIVKIIKHGTEVHFQMKEAHLESMFGKQGQDTELSNDNRPRSHIFMDPSTYYIGIGTNERTVKYPNDYLTTKPDNIQHVVIKSQTYPNVVNSRIAENFRHMNSRTKNYYFFDQFSSATMRRESNLYSFAELEDHTIDGSDIEEKEKKYGADISFELTDKTKLTREIGNIGMVIDKICENGEICGGLSVKTKPNLVEMNGKTVTKPGDTIMYVSSKGVLHISSIMLGSKLLHVEKDENGEEQLLWGENLVA